MAYLVEIAGSDSSCSHFCPNFRVSLFSSGFFNINCLFLTARHLFENLISLDQQLSKLILLDCSEYSPSRVVGKSMAAFLLYGETRDNMAGFVPVACKRS